MGLEQGSERVKLNFHSHSGYHEKDGLTGAKKEGEGSMIFLGGKLTGLGE